MSIKKNCWWKLDPCYNREREREREKERKREREKEREKYNRVILVKTMHRALIKTTNYQETKTTWLRVKILTNLPEFVDAAPQPGS